MKEGGRWKIRTFDDPEKSRRELVVVHGLVLERVKNAVHDLSEVVGRDIRCHSDRDTRGSVHEQVRRGGGKHGGLRRIAIKVGDKVDGLLVDVPHHALRKGRQAGFCISIGRGWIAVYRAKVSLAVDEWRSQIEILRHTDEGVVDSGVTVGMIFF